MGIRMMVSLDQLAWYIERDGWTYLGKGINDPSRVRYGKVGVGSVEISPEKVGELDWFRDRVYTQVRSEQIAKSLKG